MFSLHTSRNLDANYIIDVLKGEDHQGTERAIGQTSMGIEECHFVDVAMLRCSQYESVVEFPVLASLRVRPLRKVMLYGWVVET